MDRKPMKRQLTRFTSRRLRTQGQEWQWTPQGGQTSDAHGAREGSAAGELLAGQMGQNSPAIPTTSQSESGQTWPTLPQWPSLPAESSSMPGPHQSDTEETMILASASPIAEEPTQKLSAPGIGDIATLKSARHQRRFRSAIPRRRVVLVSVGVTLLICMLWGVVALSGMLSANVSGFATARRPTLPAGGIIAPPTMPQETPEASGTVSPAVTTPTAFTITFTCANGSAGGTGQLCIHTQPNATLSLTVSFCDGAFTKGKGLHNTVVADSNGNYTWQWSVSPACAGPATATATAKLAGQTVRETTTFSIGP